MTTERFKDETIRRRQGYLREVLYSVLPSIFLRAGFERYRRRESLLSLLAFPLDILAMRAFISLNVLETTLAIPDGIELRS